VQSDHQAALALATLAVATLRGVEALSQSGDVLGVLAAALVTHVERSIPAEHRVEAFREMFDDTLSEWVMQAAKVAAAKAQGT
jgi:hypothetical protein